MYLLLTDTARMRHVRWILGKGGSNTGDFIMYEVPKWAFGEINHELRK